MMEKDFVEWFLKNEKRFHQGHFDDKQIAFSAWCEAWNCGYTAGNKQMKLIQEQRSTEHG